MRRAGLSFAVAVCVSMIGVGAASAATPAKGCPASSFAAIVLNTEWQPGDAVPAAVDAWWDLTVAGIAAEGLTLEEAATALGFESVAALYEGVLLGIRGIDKNGDGEICWKHFPDHAKGTTAYFFNVVDNNARLH